MSSFEIPDGPANVKLTPGATPADPLAGSAVYGVTNKSDTNLSGRVSIQVAGDSKKEWFTIEGDAERPFAPGESQTVTVSVRVPRDAQPGEHKFRLRVVAVNDPDNDHMESPIGTIMVDAPGAPAAKKGFPWWIVLVGVAVLALVVFLFTAFVSPGFLRSSPDPEPTPTPTPTESPLPAFSEADLKGKSYGFAQGFLQALRYNVKLQRETPAGGAPDSVISAQPSTNPADPENTIVLRYDPGVLMPDFRGASPPQVQQRAGSNVKWTFCKAELQALPISNRVTAQSIEANKYVARNSSVRLTLSTTEDYATCPKFSNTILGTTIEAQRAEGANFAKYRFGQ